MLHEGAQNRPISARAFVGKALVIFTDITKQSGLNNFHRRSGSSAKSLIIDASGSGVTLLDYDNDACSTFIF